jgi:hypothetical protein
MIRRAARSAVVFALVLGRVDGGHGAHFRHGRFKPLWGEYPIVV